MGSLALAGVCAGVWGLRRRAHVCHQGPAAVADRHRLRLLRWSERIPGVRLLRGVGLKVSHTVAGLRGSSGRHLIVCLCEPCDGVTLGLRLCGSDPGGLSEMTVSIIALC